MSGLPEDLQGLGLSALVHELYPEIPEAMPKPKACRVCGSTERMQAAGDHERCAACRRRQRCGR